MKFLTTTQLIVTHCTDLSGIGHVELVRVISMFVCNWLSYLLTITIVTVTNIEQETTGGQFH